MKKLYKVFSCNLTQIERDVQVDGKTVKAAIPGTIVQLLPLIDDGSGTIKILIDDAASDMFEPETTMSVEFTSEVKS